MTLPLAKTMLKPARMPMQEGFLYEPRAFWSVGYYDTELAPPPGDVAVIRLPREHFYNGEKYPITLMYACVAPIGYTFDLYSNPTTVAKSTTRNCGAGAIADAQILISSPQRQHYARIPGLTSMLPPTPLWENAEPPGAVPPAVQRSSIGNVFSWQLDAPMVIPNRANLEFDLSRFTYPGFLTFGDRQVQAYVGFMEIGAGLFKGNMRLDSFSVQTQSADLSVPALRDTLYGPDGFPFNPNGLGIGPWNQAQRMSARDFHAQTQSSEGSIPIVGWSVMIDQENYDTALIAGAPAGTVAPTTIASLGTRIGTRARMRQGGTGAYWWRQGAPLCLVSPHRTVAQVHELHKPITLGPGGTLEVELTLPGSFVTEEDLRHRVTQIGVSLCGYAAIEA